MKGSEQRARRLHAKPEALRARGKALDQTMQDVIAQRPPICGHKADAMHVDDPEANVKATHGAGDVARENAERIAQVAAAHALLMHAAQMASDARIAVASIVGPTHPAAMAAQLTYENARRAEEHAKQLLRALGRAL